MLVKKNTALMILACVFVVGCVLLFIFSDRGIETSDDPFLPGSTAAPDAPVPPVDEPNDTTAPSVTTATSPDTSAPAETTAAPETTAPVEYPTELPDITVWDKDAHELTELLSMKVRDIKEKYGALIFDKDKSGTDHALYSLEKLSGVLLVFENRDMSLAPDELSSPDRIKLTSDYAGEIAGLAIGKSGEGILWNDALCTDSAATRLVGVNYILTALYEETEATFPNGYPGLDKEKFALWREAFCKAPVGGIIDITIEKRKEALPHGELKVISNLYNSSVHDVEIPLRTAYATYEVFDYDDRYVLYVIENRNVLLNIISGHSDTYNVELYIIDTLTGEVIYNDIIATLTEKAGQNGHLVSLLHTDRAAELSIVTMQGEVVSYDVEISESGASLTEKDSVMTYYQRRRTTSPDGRYTVFTVYDASPEASGGIDLLMSDGSSTRILTNKSGDVQSSESYSVYGFIDNTTFVYSITGWDRTKGYATYNVETGEKKEYRGSDHLAAAGDGYIYVMENEKYDNSGMRVRTALCSIDKDGNKKRIAATTVFRLEDGKRVYISEVKEGEVDLTDTRQLFEGLGWIVIGDTVNFYSADFSKLLVSISPPSDNDRLYDNVHVYNRAVTVVTPRYKG